MKKSCLRNVLLRFYEKKAKGLPARLIIPIYTCICISFFPFPFERKTISLWIWIYVQYQLIYYIYIFHFCLTYLTLCGVKHCCWKWNIFPIDWSNGPLLNVRSQKYQASLVWPAGQTRLGLVRRRLLLDF
jgi:hypothetical protein